MADIDSFMDQYNSMNDEIKPRFETLKNLDLFVLDNSIRESTVGALRGHTLQNKIDILEQTKLLGYENNIIAAFSHLRRVDDAFINYLKEQNEDFSKKYAFAEFYDECDTETHLPTPGIPIGLEKCRDLGVPNVIMECDLANLPKESQFTHEKRCKLFEERFAWIRENISENSRILINLRDLAAAMAKGEKTRRLAFQTIDFLSKHRPQIFGIMTEEPTGQYFPEQLRNMTRTATNLMRKNEFDGHFLVHVHQQWGLHNAGNLECFANGATGIWCSVSEEGAALGHASSALTIMNLIRLGNTKVLHKYHCTYLRKAAQRITKIVTGRPAHPKTPIYGARAVDQVFGLGGMGGNIGGFGSLDLAQFFDIPLTKRITTLATNQMIVDRMVRLFGEHPSYNVEMAEEMKKKMLEDYRDDRKEEYHSPVGLATLFDKAGGKKTPAMLRALVEWDIKSLHIQQLIDEIKGHWKLWDRTDGKMDGNITFDNFYNAFMKEYFGCYRCPQTKKALQAINVVKDENISWDEFEIFLKWAGKEYPETKNAEDLLDVAFLQGIVPAMQDEVIKSEKKDKSMFHDSHDF